MTLSDVSLDQIQLLSNAFVVTVTTVAGLDPVQEQKLIPIEKENLGFRFDLKERSIQI